MNQSSANNSRFVVLLHRPGKRPQRSSEPHFDWMFQWGDQLRTWATPPIDLDSEKAEVETDCEPLSGHRLDYLDYQGEISRERGNVARMLAGTYCLINDRSDRFQVTLQWLHHGRTRTATVAIYRNLLPEEELWFDDKRESWRLRFSPGRYETN